ncbi:hypothetical protein GCM10007939_10590 [Amylibacter marinus]|uniref:DUF3291 domain-containing protein n=1 Tax=Amylibacter marinus TaxID=1475483 RepID=A0ABQ5VUC9_9RHOB|nr:DUF3291 domain-containing protein [Amylibacter marinus]GLQ34776.1 hypothetical protein GCM10007939_10590 [Amylibacter marinus]
MQPTGHHLAELNVARLIAPVDDPRVADFVNNIDRINGLGKRMPGFVWIMEGSSEPNAGNLETAIGGDPQFVSNMTVWEDATSLENFVFNTVHKQIYDRRAEWMELMQGMHFVMWWVPIGHQPTLDEGLAKLAHLNAHGASDQAFGWDYLGMSAETRKNQCKPAAVV